ncbi:MAG: hypothetical protein H6566_05625 [Lewinellaceae bacterium]|nr:hypothetical protein [Lewinellaceae bacterium]
MKGFDFHKMGCIADERHQAFLNSVAADREKVSINNCSCFIFHEQERGEFVGQYLGFAAARPGNATKVRAVFVVDDLALRLGEGFE